MESKTFKVKRYKLKLGRIINQHRANLQTKSILKSKFCSTKTSNYQMILSLNLKDLMSSMRNKRFVRTWYRLLLMALSRQKNNQVITIGVS